MKAVPPLAPLIIYHTSFKPCLPFCVLQNARSNPGREVILLGDKGNRLGGLAYTHVDTARYRAESKKFLAAYQHCSRTHEEDERRCIERWFVLSEFLTEQRVSRFYFLDSDYLLFADLQPLESLWAGPEPAGTPNLFGFAFFPEARLVLQICAWILDLYNSPARLLAMQKRFASVGLALQEMGLIREFCRESATRVRNLTWWQNDIDAHFDDGLFGSSFRHTRAEFEHLRQSRPGQPVQALVVRQRRQLLGLHFGGHNKSQIPGFTGWTGGVVRSFLRPNYRRNFKYLLQYAWTGRKCRRLLARP